MDSYDLGYAIAGAAGIMVIVIWLVSLAVAIVSIIAIWKIFVKAGEPGWAAIIPFYNLYTLFKITWEQPLMFLLCLVPVANVVISIMTMLKLAKAFNKSTGFGVGLILLSVVFLPMLGFGDAEYAGVPDAR